MKVFLSHSSADKKLARKLALDLCSANVDVWLDQWEIRIGEPFAQSIEKGLAEVEFVIVLLTRSSVASEWVDREWRSKVDEEAGSKHLAVIPVRGEPCEIPDFLAQRSYADISGGGYLPGLRHLLTILRHYSHEKSLQVPGDTMERPDFSGQMIPVVTPIALEVSADLIPLFEADSEGANRALDELAPRMRQALAEEFGFLFPGVRIRGNDTDMPRASALIMLDEVPEIMFAVGVDDLLVDESVEALATIGIRGEPRNDPVTGRERALIAGADRATAEATGLKVWEPDEYIFLILQTVLRREPSLFLDIDTTRQLVESIREAVPELVTETVPGKISWFELTDVLQRLVDEEISIADLTTILAAFTQRSPEQTDSVMLAEQARQGLTRQITARFSGNQHALRVLVLDDDIEALIGSSIQSSRAGAYFALPPEQTERILAGIREQVLSLDYVADGAPLLVNNAGIRPYVRRLVKLEFPWLHVISQPEVLAGTPIEIVGTIQFGQPGRTS